MMMELYSTLKYVMVSNTENRLSQFKSIKLTRKPLDRFQ